MTTTQPSTRPYLIRAIHEWCVDSGFTPYLRILVNDATRVPMEFVRNHEIILNVSYEATGHLQIGNEAITFDARFSGAVRSLYIPMEQVLAIFAKENGEGLAFPPPEENLANESEALKDSNLDVKENLNDLNDLNDLKAKKPASTRPKLTIIK